MNEFKQLNEEISKFIESEDDMDTASFYKDENGYGYHSDFQDGEGFETLEDAIEDFKTQNLENYAHEMYRGVEFGNFQEPSYGATDDDLGTMDVYFIDEEPDETVEDDEDEDDKIYQSSVPQLSKEELTAQALIRDLEDKQQDLDNYFEGRDFIHFMNFEDRFSYEVKMAHEHRMVFNVFTPYNVHFGKENCIVLSCGYYIKQNLAEEKIIEFPLDVKAEKVFKELKTWAGRMLTK